MPRRRYGSGEGTPGPAPRRARLGVPRLTPIFYIFARSRVGRRGGLPADPYLLRSLPETEHVDLVAPSRLLKAPVTQCGPRGVPPAGPPGVSQRHGLS